MSRQIETTFDGLRELLGLAAEQREDGWQQGFEDGHAAGAEDAIERMLARLDAYRRERSGSPHDVGASVLDELEVRLRARVEDIDPARSR